MRSPENVLKSLSEKAKNKEYRYERLYRNLYNPEFYLLAYQNIATSQGSMTAGADGFTLDGMSMERIEKLIQKLRDHSYQPNPARRVYIAKKNSSKKRPLGIPSTDDKLLQEVVRMILEAIYEPTFSDNSHGFLISITGSKQDAENIKEQVKIFLKDKLNLTMSEEKTHVTHSSEKVRYLGYDIRISRSQDTKRTKKGLQRVWYGKVQLYMPKEKWIAKLHEYGAFKIKKDENGKEIWKPLHRGALMPLDDVAIISKYNSEIRGLYNYYRLAINVCNLGKFHSIMRGSCLKTLAAKYNSSVMKMYKKYRSVKGDFGADYKTKSGTKRCEFYNEGFRRNNNIAPEFVDIMPKYRGQIKPNSLAGRLKSGQCEMCGANPVKVYMHHVKRLKDLNADNEFDELMLLKRRKSLALCPKCYEEAKTKSLKL